MNSADPARRDHFAFGAGRRVCPGYHVAERSLATAIMRILRAFDVGAAPGPKLPCTADEYPGPVPGVASEKLPIILTIRNEQNLKVIDESHRRNVEGKVNGK
jgi:cytochrome P450 family 619